MAMQDLQNKEKEIREVKTSSVEQVGFHKGSLATLAKEREELIKIVSIVEQLMHVHIEALKKLGVDLEAMAKSQMEASKKDGKKLEDEL